MYVCMHKHARLVGSEGMLPQETFFLKFDALRLLLRPFWDRSRIVVATWLADNCIFGCPCAFTKPTREGTTVGRPAGG